MLGRGTLSTRKAHTTIYSDRPFNTKLSALDTRYHHHTCISHSIKKKRVSLRIPEQPQLFFPDFFLGMTRVSK
ncbi:hypothetical protein PC129_g19769 [Phytophthora cactorum]|uniref:Uncharacterized protein n=1 Tax=Phytophthora cactorum TaxID=29920 RepID=A0A8T1HA32_9STRA|nr:hypothetical protein PC111_g11056 [Phytophthora cactorum]KAG2833092.1 hypothetical protein PC113_g20637 [Phytophthora cactorum]KAG2975782.1 hypothetical protein PC119_g22396 [Phytophthora cactorum]KAG3058007.1 hypothetical protein PC122_g20841 [Phytophthora cactorum]KAG3131916.1 hypothetical protein C6341_g23136 [Phytophthora cactorum]